MPTETDSVSDAFFRKIAPQTPPSFPVAIRQAIADQIARERENSLWFGEQETRLCYGYLSSDSQAAGGHQFTAFDDSGKRFKGLGQYTDPQAEYGQFVEVDAGIPLAEPSEVAPNKEKPLDERIEALTIWKNLDNARCSSFVLAELQQPIQNIEWLGAIIFCAEDVRFLPQDHALVVDSLLKVAHSLIDQNESALDTHVWSAIRRAASLISECDVNKLCEFLSIRGAVDTRLVVLQWVCHIFEYGPAKNLDVCSLLSDRVYKIAKKFLDPELLFAGESAAIAEQSVSALAAIGDPRVLEFEETLSELKVCWFLTGVRRSLSELLKTWQESDGEHNDAHERLSGLVNHLSADRHAD